MPINTFVNLLYWFYPIGNTPAVNLLRDYYSPMESPAKALCIACGDIRNLLFTLWSQGADNGRAYYFTLCDFEPAVLARNVLLLSFLVTSSDDDVIQTELNVLWELYYHFFVTSQALTSLRTQTASLLEASKSLDDWQRSTYGQVLAFLDNETLTEIRQYWQLYHTEGRIPKAKYREEIRDVFKRKGGGGDGTVFHGARSAGFHALLSTVSISETFRRYWETGVVAGNADDLDALQRDQGGHVNPLFAHSSAASGKFAVHYGTDPLLSFHLAEAYDGAEQGSAIPDRLVVVAKSQFHAWCESFRSMAKHGVLTVSFICGEAVHICYALQEKMRGYPCHPGISYLYSRPWSSRESHLNDSTRPDACGPFDVIDCSNLGDHVGLLNLLPATVPLLRNAAHSTLYTESLLSSMDEVHRYLDDLLRTDVGSFSIIAGVIPTSSVLGTSTENYGSEAMLQGIANSGNRRPQYRCRIAWQKPCGGDGRTSSTDEQGFQYVEADAHEVASFFMKWYLRIFAPYEDMTEALSKFMNKTPQTLVYSPNHYSRITIIALLRLAKLNVRTDWSSCVSMFLAAVEKNRSLIVGTNSLQELYTLLHISGLYTVSALAEPPNLALMGGITGPTVPIPKCLSRYSELPSTVHLVLIVPRRKLQVFTSADLNRIGTPGLHIAVFDAALFENSFFTIHACFGKVVVDSDQDTYTISEDTSGWRGRSDLVVIAAVPTIQFLVGDSAQTKVALVVNTSPVPTPLNAALGLHMRVYETFVANRGNVLLLSPPAERRVSSSQSLEKAFADSDLGNNAVRISACDGRLVTLTARANISRSEEQAQLSDGCQVEALQETPCTMTIQFGSCSRILSFPSPINGARCKTKVSRKNYWIELSVDVSLALQPNGYNLQRFPVVLENGCPVAWGASRLDLDRQPVVNTTRPLDNLNSFIGMTLSQAEKDMGHGKRNVPGQAVDLWELKKSIASLILHSQGEESGSHVPAIKWKAFNLIQNQDSDLLVFANTLRHDLDLGSICLDAYVVPLTKDRIRQMSNPLARATARRSFLSIKITAGEEVLWKRILPYLVERCRYSWEHCSTCEYGTAPFVCPRSCSHGQMPICSCGEGRDTDGMPDEHSGFAPYATRIALAPISAVPIVEQMAFSPLLNLGDELLQSRDGSASNSGREVCDHCQNAAAGLKSCGACGKAKYCGKDCQKAAWKQHKLHCKKTGH